LRAAASAAPAPAVAVTVASAAPARALALGYASARRAPARDRLYDDTSALRALKFVDAPSTRGLAYS
jgi:hypothetical protein